MLYPGDGERKSWRSFRLLLSYRVFTLWKIGRLWPWRSKQQTRRLFAERGGPSSNKLTVARERRLSMMGSRADSRKWEGGVCGESLKVGLRGTRRLLGRPVNFLCQKVPDGNHRKHYHISQINHGVYQGEGAKNLMTLAAQFQTWAKAQGTDRSSQR